MAKATKTREIVLLKDGNSLTVSPTTPQVFDLLNPQLQYIEKTYLRGWERKSALREGRSPFRATSVDLYTTDFRGRIATLVGFISRIRRVLVAAGYDVKVKDLAPHPNPTVYEPDWSRLCGYDLRYRQDEVLLKMTSRQRGRIDCPAGYGKSFLIGLLASVCYRARILVTTKRVRVLGSRIYPELCGMLPDVGLLSSEGRKNVKARVMCCSSGMLHHLDDSYDFVIADEVHELAADSYAESLVRFHRARYFGLSASHDMRLDGKDPPLDGLFGPIVLSVSRQEACDRELIVPIVVQWRDVLMSEDPCEGLEDVDKERHGIWRNEFRNALIAEDARLYGPEVQVLGAVSKLEHAVYLKRHLPDYELVYRPDDSNAATIESYKADGVLAPSEPEMDGGRLSALQSGFENGTLKKAIVTTVWNVGVDFRQLGVLLRANAGGAGSDNIQLPGRIARTFDGKDYGTVHDYRDQFNRGYGRKAREREASYRAQGFEQRFPPKPSKNSLHHYLFSP